jgi:hypothetical protein
MVWKCSICYGLVGCWYLEFPFGAVLGWLLVVMPLRLCRVCFGSLLFSVLVVLRLGLFALHRLCCSLGDVDLGRPALCCCYMLFWCFVLPWWLCVFSAQ